MKQMIYRIDNIKLGINESEDTLRLIAEKKLGTKPFYFKLLKKSLDARKKTDIKWVYSIEFGGDPPVFSPPPAVKTDKKIVVIGSGPAGLFCALRLAERGAKPLLIERGEDADARARAVKRFEDNFILDPESNVQFGEGGAGTFSDGKLNTQTHNGYNREVLAYFVRFGAPAEVEYLSKPHIGSDNLPRVVKNMRGFILSRGGEVRFGTKLIGVRAACGGVRGAVLESGGARYEEEADALVLAIGHSARDTFEMLHASGFTLEPREFAVGVRIEHLRADIDASQYGAAASHLPPSDYKLVSHAGERACFTFCMCPGGVVIPSASERGGIVTNGMSVYARDGVNSNSGLLVQVKRSDFGGSGPLDGMRFQRGLEQAAYNLTNSYAAPAQTVGDFLLSKSPSGFGHIKPTYPNAVPADLRAVLPSFVTATLAAAIPDMAKRLRGFDSNAAVLTAVESRFSSPVRVLRDRSRESVDLAGIYPCGEGCGYSGGIASSAADGLAVADIILNG